MTSSFDGNTVDIPSSISATGSPNGQHTSKSLIGKKSIEDSFLKDMPKDKTKYKKENEDGQDTNKKEVSFYKYSKGISLAESIFLNNVPIILQIENGKPILNYKIELDSF